MTNQHKGYDQARDPRTGRPPLPADIEKARKQKTQTQIEREENEDLEVDEGTEATEGNPESPDNTGGERKMAKPATQFDDAGGGNDAADPDAIDEEMRNQDA